MNLLSSCREKGIDKRDNKKVEKHGREQQRWQIGQADREIKGKIIIEVGDVTSEQMNNKTDGK
jgi:hypothetical protein